VTKLSYASVRFRIRRKRLRLERRSDRNAALTRLKVFGVTFLVAGFHFDLLTRPGNPTFVDRQITLVASPRNHFNLLRAQNICRFAPVLNPAMATRLFQNVLHAEGVLHPVSRVAGLSGRIRGSSRQLMHRLRSLSPAALTRAKIPTSRMSAAASSRDPLTKRSE
jgi:hypothetical protein